MVLTSVLPATRKTHLPVVKICLPKHETKCAIHKWCHHLWHKELLCRNLSGFYKPQGQLLFTYFIKLQFKKAIYTSKNVNSLCVTASPQIASLILVLEACSVSLSAKLPTLSHPHPSQCIRGFAFIHTRN